MNKLEQKRKIQELLKSDGWGILSQKMQEEILSAAYQMAENKMLTIDEINFRRGAMFAARRLMELPDELRYVARQRNTYGEFRGRVKTTIGRYGFRNVRYG